MNPKTNQKHRKIQQIIPIHHINPHPAHPFIYLCYTSISGINVLCMVIYDKSCDGVILARIITHSLPSPLDPSNRPKFLHPQHSRSLLFPAAPLNQGALADFFHPNPQTCCHGNWAIQAAPFIAAHEWWLWVCAACVCVFVCVRANDKKQGK